MSSPNGDMEGERVQRSRKAWTAMLTGAVMAGTVAFGPSAASAARAEPNPCAGQGDHGIGGSYDVDPDGTVVWGMWYNCSGGTGADRVRLKIAHHADPDCITVPYGTYGYSSMDISRWVLPSYQGWERC